MCPEISEKPKKKLFFVSGNAQIFCFKLMVIASLFYSILALEMFHRNALLLDKEGNLCMKRIVYFSCSFTYLFLRSSQHC